MLKCFFFRKTRCICNYIFAFNDKNIYSDIFYLLIIKYFWRQRKVQGNMGCTHIVGLKNCYILTIK